MHLVNFAQVGEVIGLRWRWASNALAQVFRYLLPGLFSDQARQFGVDIEGTHRNPVQPRKFKQGQIHLRGIAPDLVPFGLLEQGLRRQGTGDPLIKHRLQAPGEHLEADHHVRPLGMQRRQRL